MPPSLDELVKQGEGRQDAVDMGDGIFMSKNIANSYLVTTPDGDVLINTGTDFEADEIKARFERVSPGPLRVITFTQGHPDHVGGWSLFNGPGVRTIAQANHSDVREYWRHLHPFYVRRIMTLWGAFMDVETAAAQLPPEPVLTDSFTDSDAFEIGGRRFELFATPGGETTDALMVWLPAAANSVHRQPDGAILRARSQPIYIARGQDSQRHGLHPLGGSCHRPGAGHVVQRSRSLPRRGPRSGRP